MGIVDNVLMGASGQGGYFLTNSLRFRKSASTYLNRTPAVASNRRTWTWSGWVKRGLLSTSDSIVLFGANSSNTDSGNIELSFTNTNTIGIVAWNIFYLNSTPVYRDPSGWYHIVFAVDTTNATANNRMRLYVNGVEITSFGTRNNPTQNSDLPVNSTTGHQIGAIFYSSPSGLDRVFDGYLDEINFVDGQQLTPSSFGAFSATTGVWQPIKYTGTYGTNGYYLPFTDNSALTTSSNVGLGRDFSGNGNYWTTNNISITAGATYDSMTDVPTLTSATTANYAVMNPNWKSSTASTSNANLTVSQTGALDVSQTTMGVSSGKWYWETTITSIGSTPSPMIGVVKGGGLDSYTSANGYYYWSNSGQKFNNGTAASYGATYTTNDVIGVALDMDAGTLTFYKNNTSQGTAYSGLSGTFSPTFTNGGGPTISWSAAVNFGQRPFAYTPPTGFNRLNTFNLPDSTIVAGNKQMDATIWTGNNTTPRSIANSGSFQPDFVWIKSRSNAYQHNLYDSVRGAGAAFALSSDQTAAEGGNSNVYGFLSAFNSTGFAVTQGTAGGGGAPNGNAYTNQSGSTYVAWQWKAGGTAVTNTAGSISAQVSANPTAGFSIVTYTGTGANATVGHGLGVAPKMIIWKNRNITASWPVWHTNFSAIQYIYLNLTNAVSSSGGSTFMNSTLPTSSVFSLGSYADVNGSGNGQVAYCWSEVAGFSRFGSYTGNGSADGPFVFTGFEPRFIMVKRSDSTGSWAMFDTSRNPFNSTNLYLNADLSDAEGSAGSVAYDLLSNGFKFRSPSSPSANLNANGGTYIYMAFAENPFKNSLAR